MAGSPHIVEGPGEVVHVELHSSSASPFELNEQDAVQVVSDAAPTVWKIDWLERLLSHTLWQEVELPVLVVQVLLHLTADRSGSQVY